MEISNDVLSLVECIESLKNDVKKKVKAIFTLRVPPKSRDEAAIESGASSPQVTCRTPSIVRLSQPQAQAVWPPLTPNVSSTAFPSRCRPARKSRWRARLSQPTTKRSSCRMARSFQIRWRERQPETENCGLRNERREGRRQSKRISWSCLPSALCLLPSVFLNPHSAIRNPQSVLSVPVALKSL